MKVRVPACAPPIPPDIGESTYVILCFLASAANSLDEIGEIVEVSTIMVPSFAASKIPPFEVRRF